MNSARKRPEMKHSAKYAGVETLRRTFPRRGLSIAAVLAIGWFLRELYRKDRRYENYVIRAYRNYYVDPTNFYKYYGSYGNS
jgi:hypothetical protein